MRCKPPKSYFIVLIVIINDVVKRFMGCYLFIGWEGGLNCGGLYGHEVCDSRYTFSLDKTYVHAGKVYYFHAIPE